MGGQTLWREIKVIMLDCVGEDIKFIFSSAEWHGRCYGYSGHPDLMRESSLMCLVREGRR